MYPTVFSAEFREQIRTAIPSIMRLLEDSDSNIRRATLDGLFSLASHGTHYSPPMLMYLLTHVFSRLEQHPANGHPCFASMVGRSSVAAFYHYRYVSSKDTITTHDIKRIADTVCKCLALVHCTPPPVFATDPNSLSHPEFLFRVTIHAFDDSQ